MFGVETLASSWEAKLLVSAIVATAAFGAVYLANRARGRFAGRINPVIVDLVSSTVIIAVVIATTLAIADVWGETETLLEQMGFLRLDARAPQLAVTIIVLIAIRVFDGIAVRLLDDIANESRALTEHQREVTLRVIQLTLWAGGLILILGVWDLDLTGLLVGAGFLGIVIGLASRKTIGSLLAGFVLMFSRPFEVGDWIVVGENEGIVSDITMMSTRIQAFDGEYVVVPNDVVSSETIVNRSRQGRLREEIEVGVDYDADLDQAREIALAAATELSNEKPEIIGSPEPDVLIRRFGDSAVVLAVRVWTDRPRAKQINRIREELIRAIKEAFDDEGIRIPYPQRELSGREEAGGFRVAARNDPGAKAASDDSAHTRRTD